MRTENPMPHVTLLYKAKKHVISTGAADGFTVRCGAERPLYFAFHWRASLYNHSKTALAAKDHAAFADGGLHPARHRRSIEGRVP